MERSLVTIESTSKLGQVHLSRNNCGLYLVSLFVCDILTISLIFSYKSDVSCFKLSYKHTRRQVDWAIVVKLAYCFK